MSTGGTVFCVIAFLAVAALAGILGYFRGHATSYNEGYDDGQEDERLALAQQLGEAWQQAISAHEGIGYLYAQAWQETQRLGSDGATPRCGA